MASEKSPETPVPPGRAAAAGESALEVLGWLRDDDEARIRRIEAELREGFATLHDVEPAVAFFGSARTPEEHPDYGVTRESRARWRAPAATSSREAGPGS